MAICDPMKRGQWLEFARLNNVAYRYGSIHNGGESLDCLWT